MVGHHLAVSLLGINPFGDIEGGYPGIKNISYSADEVRVPPFLPDMKATRQELVQYYKAVSRMDQGFSRLFEGLKVMGKYDDTVIIYLSDNGVAFPGAKTTVYDTGLHLPLIIKTRDQYRAGQKAAYFVNWADITPTILGFANVLPHTGFHGRDITPILYGEENHSSVSYASHTFHEVTMYYPMRSVRTEEYRFIWNIAYQLPFPFASDLQASATWQSFLKSGKSNFGIRPAQQLRQRPEFELYAVKADPYETQNLAYDADYEDQVSDFKKQIQRFQKETQDPWAIKWKYE